MAFGADLDAVDHEGRTLIVEAVDRKNTEAVRALLSYGAAPECGHTKDGYTALTLACKNGDLECAKALIHGGADVEFKSSGEGWTPLCLAAHVGSTEVIQLLLSRKANLNASSLVGLDQLSIHVAAFKGHSDVAKILLDDGSELDPMDAVEAMPLWNAAQQGHVDTCKIFIDRGANIEHSVDGLTILLQVILECVCNREQIATLLIDRGANIQHMNQRYTMLWSAIQEGQGELAKLLVEVGAWLETANGELEVTTLHRAAEKGLDKTIELLLSHGTNIEAKISVTGETPIFLAAQFGRISTFQTLQSRCANIHAKNSYEDEGLVYAFEHPAMLEFLLNAGFDPNHQDCYGGTVLHNAAAYGRTASARLFMRWGAKSFHTKYLYMTREELLENKNALQGTPGGFARKMGHTQIAELIENWK